MFYFCSSPLFVVFALLAGIAPHGARAQNAVAAAPVLNDGIDAQSAEAGYYTLNWSLGEGQDIAGYAFELEESNTAAFTSSTLVYRGSDPATTLSGMNDGVYFYRVRVVSEADETASPWSDTHKVTVAHHPLSRSFFFLTIGAIVFIATTALILFGKRERSL